ncbi:MAG: 3'-5' exonuclease, partial [bacterium]
ITTIDSYCRSLATGLGPESGIADTAQTLEDPQPIYRQAILDVIDMFLENAGEISDALEILLSHQDNQIPRVIDLLMPLLANRDQWLQIIYHAHGTDARVLLETFLAETISDTLERAAEAIQPVASDLLIAADYAGTNLRNEKGSDHPLSQLAGLNQLPAQSADSINGWPALARLLLTDKDEWRKPRGVDKRLGFPATKDETAKQQKARFGELLATCEELPALLDALRDVRYLPASNYPDAQWQVLESLTTLLPVLAAHLKTLFQEQNCCDFPEVAIAALNALGDEDAPTDLALRLDYRIGHILVDEFQDTSTLQFRLLEGMTRGWQENDGRTLFVVGDGMQSLYGFRNANVGLFLKARQQPVGNIRLEPLDLCTNFRSRPDIVEWANAVFRESFPQQDSIDRGAVRYAQATAASTSPLQGEAVSIDGFLDDGDNSAQAEKVADIVSRAKRENPDEVIAILVRGRGHLQSILPALKAAGLSWQATDIEPLSSQMPVIDLMSLTRALINPADRIAWLAVLRAPWAGLDLKDLHRLANGTTDTQSAHGQYPPLLSRLARHGEIKELSEAGQKILARVAPVLNRAWQQRQRKSLRSSVEGIWRQLGGDRLLDPQQLESCAAYLNLLETRERSATLEDWQAFETAVEKLFAAQDPDGDPNLKIMTVHKAKGLEFDRVIVPDINRKPPSGNRPLLLWRERNSLHSAGLEDSTQLIISPLEATGEQRDQTYLHLKREQKLKECHETARVMYVAATRAKKKLHLLFGAKSGETLTPTAGSLMDAIWPWLSSHMGSSDNSGTIHQDNLCTINLHLSGSQDVEASENPAAVVAPQITTLNRLPPDFRLQDDQKVVPLLSATGQTDNDTADRDDDASNSDATAIGTLVHRVLRRITLEGIDTWNDEKIARQSPFWRQQLFALDCSETDQALTIVKQAIKTALEDKQHHWLFDHNWPESRCEYSLGYRDRNPAMENLSRLSVIDRSFVRPDENGQPALWIVDYKISTPGDDEELESFLNRHTQLYRGQLQHYGALLRQQASEAGNTDLPQIHCLYFPLISHLEVIATDL